MGKNRDFYRKVPKNLSLTRLTPTASVNFDVFWPFFDPFFTPKNGLFGHKMVTLFIRLRGKKTPQKPEKTGFYGGGGVPVEPRPHWGVIKIEKLKSLPRGKGLIRVWPGGEFYKF